MQTRQIVKRKMKAGSNSQKTNNLPISAEKIQQPIGKPRKSKQRQTTGRIKFGKIERPANSRGLSSKNQVKRRSNYRLSSSPLTSIQEVLVSDIGSNIVSTPAAITNSSSMRDQSMPRLESVQQIQVFTLKDGPKKHKWLNSSEKSDYSSTIGDQNRLLFKVATKPKPVTRSTSLPSDWTKNKPYRNQIKHLMNSQKTILAEVPITDEGETISDVHGDSQHSVSFKPQLMIKRRGVNKSTCHQSVLRTMSNGHKRRTSRNEFNKYFQ
ncbi:uncharacterized protein LOC142342081 isoform X3 [Convolutriloba macropyga]|uniref:uncharacterized protein LOC142342081 isoform X3 n=1 Tax=Convolutriloba macropyga TaxID=536237 RepID=UPI003F51AC81